LRGVAFALLAIAASVGVLGYIAVRDPKRLRAQEGEEEARRALSDSQRRALALAALAPGLLLMLSGWWSSVMIWTGATVVVTWLWVLWLSRPRRTAAGVKQAEA
jgi:hypothetical protein